MDPSTLADYCRFGVVYPQSFPDSLDATGSAFFDGIERVASWEPVRMLELAPPTDVDDFAGLRKLVEERSLPCLWLGGLPMMRGHTNGLCLDGEEGSQALAYGRSLIDQAYDIKAESLLVLSGPDSPDHRRPRREQLAANLTELCRYAEDQATSYVLDIRLEPTDRTTTFHQLIGPTEEAVGVLEVVAASGVSNASLNLDLSHLDQLGDDWDAALRMARPWCRHVHVANCVIADPGHPMYGDRHPPFGAADSEVDIAALTEFLRLLCDHGYLRPGSEVVLSSEVKPLAGEDPWGVLQVAYADVLAAWSGVELDG